jgi:GT2 family glycosyltransferase
MSDSLRYVLISAVKNEIEYIRHTLESVVSQSIRPLRWVIVNDHSTDGTDAVVRAFAAEHPFIQLLDIESRTRRSFAFKSHAVRKGYDSIKSVAFEFVGNLDGDISLPPDYYEAVMREFYADPRLGMAAGAYLNRIDGKLQNSIFRSDNVPGPIQFFRRACFDEIGGYLPLRKGGIDTAAECYARMKGWRTRLIPGLHVIHNRQTGAGEGRNSIKIRYRQGVRDYTLGYHPLYMWAKTAIRLRERPYVVGSLASITGYLHAWLRGEGRELPGELQKFIRREQLQRLKVVGFARRAAPSDTPGAREKTAAE